MHKLGFKGIVQQKLRWVEIGIKFLPTLEPKLSVMLERIGEALMYSAYQFAENGISANMSGAI
jgi:hypothetical protein